MDKDTSIVTQVSAKIAAELTVGGKATGSFYETTEEVLKTILQLTDQYAPQTTAQAVRNVQNAFPGATVETQAPAAAPQQAPQVTGGNPGDIGHLIANPAEYYDNVGDERASTGGGNGPDFKHKESGKGIWLKGKYPLDPTEQQALVSSGLVHPNVFMPAVQTAPNQF